MSGSEIIPVFPAEFALAEQLAAPQLAGQVRNKRAFAAKYTMYVRSRVAEWKVDESLGAASYLGPEDYRTADTTFNGVRLSVRYRHYRYADLMSPGDQPLHCDWWVLVCPAEPGFMEIVGAATREQMAIRDNMFDAGNGLDYCARRNTLRPWTDLRDELLSPASV